MSNSNLKSLQEKFQNLWQWQVHLQSPQVPHNYDQFVLACLKIIATFENDVSFIAKEFYFIVEKDKCRDLFISLRKDLEGVESTLPAEMRGFSSLFDAVFDELAIGIDYEFILKKIPKNCEKLTSPVKYFLASLALYKDLICNNHEEIIVLFLIMVRQLHCIIGQHPKALAHVQISEWMTAWGVNEKTRLLFRTVSSDSFGARTASGNVAKVLRVV